MKPIIAEAIERTQDRTVVWKSPPPLTIPLGSYIEAPLLYTEFGRVSPSFAAAPDWAGPGGPPALMVLNSKLFDFYMWSDHPAAYFVRILVDESNDPIGTFKNRLTVTAFTNSIQFTHRAILDNVRIRIYNLSSANITDGQITLESRID
jgi:hypothetical protein